MNKLNHVEFIMEGNGRWGKKKSRGRNFGHYAGVKTVKKIVEASIKFKIPIVTFYVFSTENWKRTQLEVSGLMKLFKRYIYKETQPLVKAGVRVRFIGDRLRLEPSLVNLMDQLEELTENNSTVNLTIAINYGARDEVTRAAKRMAKDVLSGDLNVDSINEETLPKYLDTHVLPDPGLVIRTSGEARISNFLLWQSAYAEYEFIDTLWPDFTKAIFSDLVNEFGNRERRFGGVL